MSRGATSFWGVKKTVTLQPNVAHRRAVQPKRRRARNRQAKRDSAAATRPHVLNLTAQQLFGGCWDTLGSRNPLHTADMLHKS